MRQETSKAGWPDNNVAGGIVVMNSCTGKTRVMAAMIALRPTSLTLVVTKTQADQNQWLADCKLFGIACAIAENNATLTSLGWCDGSSAGVAATKVVVTTWDVLQSSGWPAELQQQTKRIIYDDFVSYSRGNFSRLAVPVVWGVTTPEDFKSRKIKSHIKFLFWQANGNAGAGGVLERVCHAAAVEPVAGNFSEIGWGDKLASVVLSPLIVVHQDVPPGVVQTQERITYTYTPDTTWAAMHKQCVNEMGAFTSKKFRGAVAGNNDFTLQDLKSVQQQHRLEYDDAVCPVCLNEGYEMEVPVMLHPCNHLACRKCIQAWFVSQCNMSIATCCPQCRQPTNFEDIHELSATTAATLPQEITMEHEKAKLQRNTGKINFILQTCCRFLHAPRTRLILMSQYRCVRAELKTKVESYADFRGANACVTTDCDKFIAAVKQSTDNQKFCVLVTSPRFFTGNRATNMVGNADVLMFAEPCKKSMLETVCKRFVGFIGESTKDIAVFHKPITIATIVTDGTHESHEQQANVNTSSTTPATTTTAKKNSTSSAS